MIQPGTAQTEHHDQYRPQRLPDLLDCVLEALPLGIALFEIADGGIFYLAGNHEFAKVVRLPRPPREGQPLNRIFAHAEGDAIQQMAGRVARREEPQSYFAAKSAEDQSMWNIDAYPVFTGGRVSHVMLLAEQSNEQVGARQRQQHETNRLREKADHLEGLEKVKSEFLRLASHELRGPAAMLGGYLSMMEDETLGPIPERMRPVLPLLRAKAGQINLLANEMVEAARLEDRRLQLKRRKVDLGEVVRRSINAAAVGLSDKHRLRFEDRTAAPVMVYADTMRLEIIIGNLIDNAIKYSPDGGDVSVELSTSGQMALLSIRDVGIGIAPEDMKRLFIRFNRIEPRPDVPGTGLGLYLARELARLHGGDIVAVSKLGEGSEFTLSLPLDPAKK